MYSKEELRRIAEKIKEDRVTVAEIVSGSHMGEKLVFSGKDIICQHGESKLLLDQREKLENTTGVERLELDGQQVFVDVLNSQKKLVICGAGHVSMPIIQIGTMLGFSVTVLEDRPEFANHARTAGADSVICDSFSKGLAMIPGDRNTFFIIVTRGHRYDEECLQAIFSKERAYVGMMGSKGRVLNVKHDMEKAGIAKEEIDTLYAPIGEAISAETPEEIAVSIIAQIIRIRREDQSGAEGMADVLQGVFAPENETYKKTMVTVISKKGAAPRGIGTKMLILENGSTCGTIGGGCAEARVIQIARQMMTGATMQTVNGCYVSTVDMTGQDIENDGMACGGIEEVLLELVRDA